MMQQDNKFWSRAQHAREKLAAQYLGDSDVSLIDIGRPMAPAQKGDAIVIRIHVRKRWLEARPEDRTAFPAEFEGIPVIVMHGDYQFETDAGSAGEG
jgi:hypothetical protein